MQGWPRLVIHLSYPQSHTRCDRVFSYNLHDRFCQNVILSSCLTFHGSVYYRTSDNTFIPISNSEKPVAGNKCYVQTKDIIIHPLTEYLSNDINQCGATSCHTCNIFINDQFFKSNLTGKEYKTISYDRLSCGSTNVIYGIHCVHCGLVYIGETGRSLRSRMKWS